ncbi:unnamed protein product [Adineta steineri]|uniref:Transglutaminase-like domain-containing protein n=1 Tax=Adineta steineri TaxID=433720 RepID=A0A819RIY7_9BILA|nr:unnamed protein product [Adineta steineri]
MSIAIHFVKKTLTAFLLMWSPNLNIVPVTTTRGSLLLQRPVIPIVIRPNLSDLFVDQVRCGCCISLADYFSDDIVGGDFSEVFCRQRQASIDNASLRTTVESWSQVGNMEYLCNLILAYAQPMDRIWLVFYWISQNISYGAQWNVNLSIPESVFIARQGVCDGYASLFQHLSNMVGVPCRKVSGLAKGGGYLKPLFLGSVRWCINCSYPPIHIANHAWNAVRLGDRSWYLIDSTWGAGHRKSITNEYCRELDTHYFLTRPEHFLYSHLPSSATWQLVAGPERLSYNTFVSRPLVWSAYFDLQLQVVEPTNSPEVTFDKQRGFAEVLIRAPNDVVISSSLQKNNINSSNEQCLVQFLNEQQLWQCLFLPQQCGTHAVTIFGRRQNSSNNGQCAMKFYLNVPLFRSVKLTKFPTTYKGFSDYKCELFEPLNVKLTKFPTTYKGFSDYKCELFEPLNGELKQGSQITIHCRISEAISVRLILDDNEWLPEDGYNKETGHFKKTITVPKQKITLNVKNKKETTYSTLVLYTVI